MNNEPVAWTDGKGNFFDKNSFFPVDDLIPLYTHPAELTDEEITVCMGLLPKYNSEIVDEDLVKFARAILRKAQEK